MASGSFGNGGTGVTRVTLLRPGVGRRWLGRSARGMVALGALGLALVAGCTAPAAAGPAAPPAPVAAPAPRVTVDPPDGAKAVAPSELVTRHGERRHAVRRHAHRRRRQRPARRPRHGRHHLASHRSPEVRHRLPLRGHRHRARRHRAGHRHVHHRRAEEVRHGDHHDRRRRRPSASPLPIMIQFSRSIPQSSRAAVERALSVTTSAADHGVVGVADRRLRRIPRALAPQGLLAGRHHGEDGRAPLRRGHGHGRVRQGRPHHRLHDRALPDRQGRRQHPPHPGRSATARS